jgi:hypothetical protein
MHYTYTHCLFIGLTLAASHVVDPETGISAEGATIEQLETDSRYHYPINIKYRDQEIAEMCIPDDEFTSHMKAVVG